MVSGNFLDTVRILPSRRRIKPLETSQNTIERLVVDGNFHRDSGRQAIVELLDNRNVSFDAVIAANDFMAIYAMKEMQKRGLKVPEDVAIAGFDDTDAAFRLWGRILIYKLTR